MINNICYTPITRSNPCALNTERPCKVDIKTLKYKRFHAGIAKLADAHGSDPCGSHFMEVRVLMLIFHSFSCNEKWDSSGNKEDAGADGVCVACIKSGRDPEKHLNQQLTQTNNVTPLTFIIPQHFVNFPFIITGNTIG